MSKNLKNIIKEVLNESDFDWIDEDLIKVGNCFVYYPPNLSMESWNIKVTEIEVPTDVASITSTLTFTNVHFTGTHISRYGGHPSLKFKLTYSEVEQWLEQGIIVPTDCTDVT